MIFTYVCFWIIYKVIGILKMKFWECILKIYFFYKIKFLKIIFFFLGYGFVDLWKVLFFILIWYGNFRDRLIFVKFYLVDSYSYVCVVWD